jgi:hypothetical protein
MEPALDAVQIIRIALLVSIPLYLFVGERAAPGAAAMADRNFYFVLTLVALTTVGMAFAVWRLFVLHSEALLAAQPDDAAALGRWRSGFIITYGLSEAVALFGLVLRIMGFSLSEVAPFYLVGFVLLLLFSPRRTKST